MRKIAVLALVLTLAATSTIAQEAQDEESMFVMINYVTIKPGMEQAFMGAVAGHLEWHKSTNDDHYYNAGQVVTGPRTGQFVWSAGPMTGERLDDYSAFMETDMADWTGRGGMQTIDAVETHVYATIPGVGNPPPPDFQATMVNIYEFEIEFVELNAFHEALSAFKALEDQIGHDDYFAWTAVVSGDSLSKRHYVQWVDSWGDMMPNPAREVEMAAAAGGDEAYAELIEEVVRGIESSTSHTLVNLPHLSFQPEGQ